MMRYIYINNIKKDKKMTRQNIKQSVNEIFKEYKKRSYTLDFTLDSINLIFEVGNEVFMKNNQQEIEKLYERPVSHAPDIMDDEPFTLERTMAIFEKLESKFTKVNPELIQKVFETNSRLAWKDYKQRYFEYISDIYRDYPEDEYINYLASVVFYDCKNHPEALKCINLALSLNNSCALYMHLKGLCLMQSGEFDSARTYLYQALFLIELLQDVPPKLKGDAAVYPTYPIEYHTSADVIRNDLVKLDKMENVFKYQLKPMLA